MLCGPLPHIKQAIMRRYVCFLQNLLHSEIPVIHDLAHSAVRTAQSVTGLNVLNIRQSFNCNPLSCNPLDIISQRKEIPEGGEETLDLLARLLDIRSNEIDEDIVSDLDDLISDVCL